MLLRGALLLALQLAAICAQPSLSENVLSRDVQHLRLRPRSSHSIVRRANGQLSTLLVSQGYNALIQIGPWNFEMFLDTASSDLWVISSACKSRSCQNIPIYSTSESSTFVALDPNQSAFSLPFVDGSILEGIIGREVVKIGNYSVSNQTLALISTSNATLPPDVSGGLGLGFPRLSSISAAVDHGLPLFSNLAQRGALSYPLFTLNLDAQRPRLSLGAIDANIIHNLSLVNWHPVEPFPSADPRNQSSPYLQWATRLTSVLVDSTSISLRATYPQSARNHSLALLDVGTDGLYGPYQDVENVFAQIIDSRLAGDGQWAIPCDAAVPITFTLGAHNYTLTPTELIIGRLEGSPNYCLSYPFALPPSTDGIDWQLGARFLQTAYSIFSFGIDTREPPYIGLYPLSSTLNSPPTTTALESATLSSASIAPFATTSSSLPLIPLTLPNTLNPTPTFTTPPYQFLGTLTPTLGIIASSGLGASTYTPLIAGPRSRPTALPVIHSDVGYQTLVVTDSRGVSHTTVVSSYVPDAPSATTSILLGAGQNRQKSEGGMRLRVGRVSIVTAFLAPVLYLL